MIADAFISTNAFNDTKEFDVFVPLPGRAGIIVSCYNDLIPDSDRCSVFDAKQKGSSDAASKNNVAGAEIKSRDVCLCERE